jgi:Zn-dependent peptidase ImmA (M78 family)/transcriptional regulator with XRE-family HTH domain
MKVINPHMIVLARESRGMTQQELADKIDSYKVNISRLERGQAEVNDTLLERLSDATGYPIQFFYQPGEQLPLYTAYRKRQHVPAAVLNPIEAQVNIIRLNVELLTTLGGMQPPLLPFYQNADPASAAQLLRKEWLLPKGPVDELLALLESKGIFIQELDFNTTRVDSRSVTTENGFPLIILNTALTGDRQRFSLAYELGHLVLHKDVISEEEGNISHNANAFAAAFLMPEQDIRPDFEHGITLPLLASMKKKWLVSMIALLYRADDLGFITANQKRYLLQQFNQQDIRRHEPEELNIEREAPAALCRLMGGYRLQHGLGLMEMAALLSLDIGEYIGWYTSA